MPTNTARRDHVDRTADGVVRTHTDSTSYFTWGHLLGTYVEDNEPRETWSYSGMFATGDDAHEAITGWQLTDDERANLQLVEVVAVEVTVRTESRRVVA